MNITYDLEADEISYLLDQKEDVLKADLESWTFNLLRAKTVISPLAGVNWFKRWTIVYLALELLEAKKAIHSQTSCSIAYPESMLKLEFTPKANGTIVAINYRVLEDDVVEIPTKDFCLGIDRFVNSVKADLVNFVPEISKNQHLRPLFHSEAT